MPISIIILAFIFRSILRNGFTFFNISNMLFLIYFYPVLLSNRIYIWDVDTINVYEVSNLGRYLLYVISIVFIALDRGAESTIKSTFAYSKYRSQDLRMMLIMVIFPFIFYLCESISSIRGNGFDKTLLMNDRSYLSNYIEASALLLFAYGLFANSKLLIVFSLLVSIVQMSLGFRYTITHQLIIFTLFLSLNNSRINIRLFSTVAVIALLIVGLKLFNYSLPSPEQISDIAERILGQDGGEFIYSNILNPESTSISVVFNEIVKSNYTINSDYFIDIIFSIIPFIAKMLGMDVHGFAYYLKTSLLGSDAESFASGMPSFYMALGGPFFFVFLIVIQYYTLFRILLIAKLDRYGLHTRAFIIVGTSVSICYGLRSDPVYLITLYRNIIASALLFYVVLKMLKLAKNSGDKHVLPL